MCIELTHLRYVVAAAEHRSFRRAAAALNIAQPTLSKRIREIEDRLSILLFERSAGGVRLTAIGRDFVQSARRILAELEAMKARAHASKVGDAGRLDIGFYTSLSTGALRDTLLTFADQHSGVEVNIVEGERASLIPLLDCGEVDLVVLLGEPIYTNYGRVGLWSEKIMVALPKHHPLAAREFVHWTDLKSERFLMSRRDAGPEIQDVLVSKLTSPGDRPHIKPINAHREDILSVVNGGRGVTLTCESSIGNVMPGVVFREVRDGNGPTRIGYVAYWRLSNENPVLKQFLDFLRTHPAIPPTGETALA